MITADHKANGMGSQLFSYTLGQGLEDSGSACLTYDIKSVWWVYVGLKWDTRRMYRQKGLAQWTITLQTSY